MLYAPVAISPYNREHHFTLENMKVLCGITLQDCHCDCERGTCAFVHSTSKHVIAASVALNRAGSCAIMQLCLD